MIVAAHGGTNCVSVTSFSSRARSHPKTGQRTANGPPPVISARLGALRQLMVQGVGDAFRGVGDAFRVLVMVQEAKMTVDRLMELQSSLSV